jgi:hypothetical protein
MNLSKCNHFLYFTSQCFKLAEEADEGESSEGEESYEGLIGATA